MQTMAPHYSEWIGRYDFHVAGTLNFTANTSREKAEEAALKYWHRIDCALFGATQAKKNKERLVRACVLGGESKLHNWHYHCAVQLPTRWRGHSLELDTGLYQLEFCAYLLERWEWFEEAGKFSVFEPIENKARWLKYICEEEGYGEGEFCARTTYLGA